MIDRRPGHTSAAGYRLHGETTCDFQAEPILTGINEKETWP